MSYYPLQYYKYTIENWVVNSSNSQATKSIIKVYWLLTTGLSLSIFRIHTN